MRADWPVIGRGEELTTIRSALSRGVGTVVVGEPGGGKTMLLRELKRLLDADGHHAHLALATAVGQFPVSSVDEFGVSVAGVLASAPATKTVTPQVLIVDDAHLLDAESAAALWRLAATRRAAVVAAVRAGEPVPVDIDRLWTSGECDRVELEPFGEGDVRVLLELVLGGDVEDRVARLLVTRSGGNALLLRELVRSGVGSGALTRRHEVWSLVADLPLGAGVRHLIQGMLAGLSEDELLAAQLFALAEPLPLAVGDVLVDASVLESLEAQGVVVVQDIMDGPVLTLGHPLYGEVLRAEIAPLRLRRLRLELAQAVDSSPNTRPWDTVRATLWRVEAGAFVDAGALLDAARLARTFSGAV
ncbi:MAG: ATP-binding protein, partial [Jatrophihabitantaceae bacterium]